MLFLHFFALSNSRPLTKPLSKTRLMAAFTACRWSLNARDNKTVTIVKTFFSPPLQFRFIPWAKNYSRSYNYLYGNKTKNTIKAAMVNAEHSVLVAKCWKWANSNVRIFLLTILIINLLIISYSCINNYHESF